MVAELQEIEIAHNPEDFEWEIVDNAERKVPKTKYIDNLITQAFKDDKTIKVPKGVRLDKYRRWAKANKYILRTKTLPDGILYWVTPEKNDG
jgi:hypothetical protein